MAITEDSVYSGAYEPNYAQPIGFYFNSVACTNQSQTIVDDAMDANADTLCSITASINKASTAERVEFVFFVDGTQIQVANMEAGDNHGDSQPYTTDLIIPAGTNLKITGDNQSSATSTECSAYVIIKPLAGTSTT
tara:strand:+ start:54 stop:461 length:408 start_codon:yes stop_codon:yes gene_type:complete